MASAQQGGSMNKLQIASNLRLLTDRLEDEKTFTVLYADGSSSTESIETLLPDLEVLDLEYITLIEEKEAAAITIEYAITNRDGVTRYHHLITAADYIYEAMSNKQESLNNDPSVSSYTYKVVELE